MNAAAKDLMRSRGVRCPAYREKLTRRLGVALTPGFDETDRILEAQTHGDGHGVSGRPFIIPSGIRQRQPGAFDGGDSRIRNRHEELGHDDRFADSDGEETRNWKMKKSYHE